MTTPESQAAEYVLGDGCDDVNDAHEECIAKRAFLAGFTRATDSHICDRSDCPLCRPPTPQAVEYAMNNLSAMPEHAFLAGFTAGAAHERARAEALVEALEDLRSRVKAWCDAVDRDSSWDGWDDHFKDFQFSGSPNREGFKKCDEALAHFRSDGGK